MSPRCMLPMGWLVGGARSGLVRGALVLFGLGACVSTGTRPPVRVLTTFQPLYSLAHALAQDTTITVENVAPPGFGPHDYDPAEAPHAGPFAAAVRGADALVTLGRLSLAEPFDRLYAEARCINIRIVELDPSRDWRPQDGGLVLLPEPVDRQAAAPVGPPRFNPHVWLSLSHATVLARRLAADLCLLSPADAPTLTANADRLVAELRSLRSSYLDRLAEVPAAEVVALTEGFPYLTADLGIAVLDTVREAEGAAAVAARVRATGATVVVAEEEPPPDWRASLAGLGVRLVVLDTLETGRVRDGRLDPSGYQEGMRENLERLVEALEQEGLGYTGDPFVPPSPRTP